MTEFLSTLDWETVITTIWTVILLPSLTYASTQITAWAKTRKIDQYTTILQNNVVIAVKDVWQTIVKDIKGTEEWTPEKQAEVKELAKQKAISALTNSAYQCLKQANDDFDEYLDILVESSLFDAKSSGDMK